MSAKRQQGGAVREVVGRRVAPGAASAGDFTYSVIEVARPGAAADRRAAKRVASHLREAMVREPRGRAIADCRIRDLSRTGARLQLDRERPLPKSFVLRDGNTRAYEATLVWQAGRDAGVRLTEIAPPARA